MCSSLLELIPNKDIFIHKKNILEDRWANNKHQTNGGDSKQNTTPYRMRKAGFLLTRVMSDKSIS